MRTLATISLVGALLVPVSGTNAAPAATYPRGVHPYPRGDEWPAGLSGPFARQAPFRARVPSHDGVELEGWIQLPVLPAGVRAPVVLVSSPYFGQTVFTAETDTEFLPRQLVDHGYAVAGFSVRGTGNSGGCFEFFGPKEQRDQPVLVEWLARQPWSNGRVGMYGLSYMGTTPWEAAIQNPPHLKTIVVAGMVGDTYNFFHTPQGAPFTIGPAFSGAFAGLTTVAPPVLGPPTNATVDHLGPRSQRTCPEVATFTTDMQAGNYTDQRMPAAWQARRLSHRFDQVTTSVFVTHGFQDLWVSGHAFQEDYVWPMLRRAPKRMLLGQWAHEFPTTTTWADELRGWLDFWLKGIGDRPPRLGLVDYADDAGTWQTTTRWPPANRVLEVLYLDGASGLARTPPRTSASFRSVPTQPVPSPDEEQWGAQLCPVGAPGVAPPAAVYTTAPVPRTTVVAGNPFAYLRLRSDLPGGLVYAHLVDLGPDFACANGRATGSFRVLTFGSADLRYHRGGYTGRAFPGEEHVRVDIANVAHPVAAGHRLALVLSYGDVTDRSAAPYPSVVNVLGGDAVTASQLVLPVTAGSFGGGRPRAAYPQPPFPGARDAW